MIRCFHLVPNSHCLLMERLTPLFIDGYFSLFVDVPDYSHAVRWNGKNFLWRQERWARCTVLISKILICKWDSRGIKVPWMVCLLQWLLHGRFIHGDWCYKSWTLGRVPYNEICWIQTPGQIFKWFEERTRMWRTMNLEGPLVNSQIKPGTLPQKLTWPLSPEH